jgi:hypothetical protein
MLEFFLALVFVHFVFDFALQSKFMSDYKGKLTFVMGVHVFIWTWAVCTMITQFVTLPLWMIPFLFLGHWFSDQYKIHLIEKEKLEDENDPKKLARLKFLFHVDQVWHLVQLAIVVLLA